MVPAGAQMIPERMKEVLVQPVLGVLGGKSAAGEDDEDAFDDDGTHRGVAWHRAPTTDYAGRGGVRRRHGASPQRRTRRSRALWAVT